MKYWEYEKIELNDLPRGMRDMDLLNAAGADGWELVAVTASNCAILKRPIATASTAASRTRAKADR